MPDGLFGVLRHQGLELTFCPLMIEKGLAGVAEEAGKFRPGIRGAHVDDAYGLDPKACRSSLDTKIVVSIPEVLINTLKGSK